MEQAACYSAGVGAACASVVECVFTYCVDLGLTADQCIASINTYCAPEPGTLVPQQAIDLLDCIFCTACVAECNGDPPTRTCP